MNNIAAMCSATARPTVGARSAASSSSSPATPGLGHGRRHQPATWAFWQNVKYSGVADGGAAITSANIQSYMNALAIKLTRGTDAPDLIVADDVYYGLYLSSLQAIQRITDEKMAGAGFTSLKYFGVGGNTDVVLERSSGPFANSGMPGSRMYFLNTDYIYFRPHTERNFIVDDAERTNPNQDAFVKLLFWAGNMTCATARSRAS
jgi:hypothetical protein